jgi:MFS family permease
MIEKNNGLASPNRSRFFYGYNIVILAFFLMVMAYGVRTSFGVFFKPIEAEMGWSRALISGAVTVSMIVQGLWGIYMGRINDKFGSRWVLTLCSFFLGLGLILVSLTTYSWQLYIFYGILAGLGMGGVFVALMSTVSRWFIKKRALMSGVVLAGIGVGTVTFAPVSNWLISLYGWRESNVIIGAAVMICGIAAAQFLRRDPARMGLLPYGQTRDQPVESASHFQGLSLKAASKTWRFWLTSVMYICVGYCTFTITIHLVPLVTDLGISAATAAGILAVSGALQSVGNIIFGIVADRTGSRYAIIISLILTAAGLFWLVPISSVLMFYGFAVVYSLGVGGATALESPFTAELFGMKSHGVLLGIVSFGFTIGGAIGPVVTGHLFDITGNYTLANIICASVGVLGILLTLIIKTPQRGSYKG